MSHIKNCVYLLCLDTKHSALLALLTFTASFFQSTNTFLRNITLKQLAEGVGDRYWQSRSTSVARNNAHGRICWEQLFILFISPLRACHEPEGTPALSHIEATLVMKGNGIHKVASGSSEEKDHEDGSPSKQSEITPETWSGSHTNRCELLCHCVFEARLGYVKLSTFPYPNNNYPRFTLCPTGSWSKQGNGI